MLIVDVVRKLRFMVLTFIWLHRDGRNIVKVMAVDQIDDGKKTREITNTISSSARRVS